MSSNCNECKHGYDLGVENPEEDWHMLCGAGHCYLCEQARGNHCEEFVKGDIPSGRKRF